MFFPGFIFIIPISVFESYPIISASNTVLSLRDTFGFLPVFITWAFVTIYPSSERIIPEPLLTGTSELSPKQTISTTEGLTASHIPAGVNFPSSSVSSSVPGRPLRPSITVVLVSGE